MSHRRDTLLLAAALLAASHLAAQEVPRAIPVEDEQRPIPKAIPVGPPPTAAPARPKGPDRDLFDYATMIYERGEHTLAAQSFGQYLQNYPSGADVPMAMFRLGECYLKMENQRVAETYYREVVDRFPNSEGAPSAAYRLGALRFNARDFAEAARQFALCETKSPLPQVRLAASYNKARAYQMLGDTKRQTAALQAVLAIKTENPYREGALLALGTVHLAEDRKTEALPLFLELVQESKDNPIISDASVKAGVLLAETGRPEEAIPLFQRALTIAETTPANRGIALVGVVQALFAKGDYDGVINNYTRNSSVLPEGDTRPKMLLLVGNAYRMKKSYSRAVEVYLMVEQDYPASLQAFEAGYWKLYCFYLLDDKELGVFASTFIQRYAPNHSEHEFLNLARLIRADFHFNRQEYPQSAESFSEVGIEKLPAKLQPGALFNKGWAFAEAKRPQDAVAAFSQFLAEHPAHELTAKALARRGLSYREARDVPKAVTDFQRVVKEYTNSEAAEMCYLQLGLIAGEQRDYKAMISAFEMLVTKYPSSPAAAQAWFGIGRGHFDQKAFDQAVPALQKSIEKDRQNYLDRASQMIILALYAQQSVDALAQAIDDYRKANPNASIPPNTIAWLGLKLFDLRQYERSAKYLVLATTPEEPQNTDPRVWNYLGMARLETRDYEGAITATDHYLAVTPDSANKARALVTKGRSLLGLARLDDAQKIVQEGLSFAKDGRPQAMLLILEADIALAAGDKYAAGGQTAEAKNKYSAAASKLMIPAQFLVDDELTPEALYKLALALEKAGQAAKAADFRKTLQEKYPKWQAPAD